VYCVYAESGWKNTGMHPARTASNVDRRVAVSPRGWRQKLELSNRRITAPGDASHSDPLAHRNIPHRLDAPHCWKISARTVPLLPGRAAPANEKSHRRSAARAFACQARTSAAVAGWKLVG